MQRETNKLLFSLKIISLTGLFQKEVDPLAIETGIGYIPTDWTNLLWPPANDFRGCLNVFSITDGEKKSWLNYG